LGSCAWVSSWLDANASSVLIRPDKVLFALFWGADASTVILRPMGSGSAHEWAADARVRFVGPDFHVFALSWNHEAIATRLIPVLANRALSWSANAITSISGPDFSDIGADLLSTFASTSLGVEVVVAISAIFWGTLAFTVHLIPVVSFGTCVVLLGELALASGEVPDESWLAPGWSALALAVLEVEVGWFVADRSALLGNALTLALVLVPLSVFVIWLSSVCEKARIWLGQALALTGLSVPNEIGHTWEISYISKKSAVSGWNANTSALIVIPDSVV